jgi:ABC-type sugar transport system ATPase subunit
VDGAAHFAGGRVALTASLASAGSSARGSVELGIRPEHVVLAREGSEQTIAARVERVDDQGRRWTARMRVGASTLLVTGPDGRQPRAGEACGLGLPAERLHLFADGRAVTP